MIAFAISELLLAVNCVHLLLPWTDIEGTRCGLRMMLDIPLGSFSRVRDIER